ncbi:hypothetical protein SCH01S_28_01200 [Sphingomonas changbaiensis NBRC 104936]|uniref:EthD domain-containing protein n=1 Tax=Sphingomonas changbaiensis NBRC 104936 TaxID=1219043 RepID=A0A0E9MNY0_9SPHN|nr:EthD family reductase [Sphingomonas changbaiensis]GAO39259.1 hypothetical protein SCH01S_28_01200 [Sphingomonas changbaiensis NBRC 104936]
MIVVSVMYGPDARFDEDYYLATHMPLVRERWHGLLSDARVLKGLPAPDGAKPAYQIMAELTFPSPAELQQAMGGPHAAEIMADIANFTDARPVMQVSSLID